MSVSAAAARSRVGRIVVAGACLVAVAFAGFAAFDSMLRGAGPNGTPSTSMVAAARNADRIRLGSLVADPFTIGDLRDSFAAQVDEIENQLAESAGRPADIDRAVSELVRFRAMAERQFQALDGGDYRQAMQIAGADAAQSADDLFVALEPFETAGTRPHSRSPTLRWLLVALLPVIASFGLRHRSAQSKKRRITELTDLATTLHEHVVITDDDGFITQLSEGVPALVGAPAGTPMVRIDDVLKDIERATLDEIRRGVSATSMSRKTSFVRRARGLDHFVEVTVSRCTIGKATLLWVLNDASERHRVELELVQKAFHDTLTGLPNRALFRDRATVSLARAGRSGAIVSVLFIDLDGFKNVNDSLGHEAGDELIVEMGLRLRALIRPSDTLARLGGDEFAVLVEDPRTKLADVLANRMLDAIRQPSRLRGKEVFVGASIGIAEAAPEITVEEILRNADTAMYAAKEQGKNRVVRFHNLMFQEVAERLELDSELRRAIELNQLRLYFQPIVSLADNRMHGVEALLRWFHPHRGVVPPDVFIPLSEETGSIVDIGRWALREAIAEAARLPPDLGISMHVNVSAKQLADEELLGIVKEELARTGLPPERLILEITESVVLDDIETTVRRLNDIREIGVKLAIDDFGTGYSSLSYLHRLPVNSVKIDRSFICERPSRRELEADSFVRAILELAKALGFETVAEGVESEEQLIWLREHGCTYGQGYFFARPLPAESLQRAAEESSRRESDLPFALEI
jgi:diguanylate cyclase (GGDEF)-like protein